ncbi:MAG: DUF1152 domain-containing protein [Solirubrobacteraceae bacterium]
MGGGGDVVGALATAELVRGRGRAAVVGGTTWERSAIDPEPGPRTLDEVLDAERLAPAIALAGPRTRTRSGVRFAEARLAEALDETVVLLDVNGGPAAIERGIAAATAHLECDLVVLVDVGGDVLAHGGEPGLGSPLCDAVVLAAAPALARRVPVVLGVFGTGCDGELTPDEVLARVAEVAAAGGLLGAWGLTPEAAQRVETAVAAVPTEASAQALACARGAHGTVEIRGGRRTVQRTPVGALTFYLDAGAALRSAARLARAVGGAASLDDANAKLGALGVSTELDWERRVSGASPPPER